MYHWKARQKLRLVPNIQSFMTIFKGNMSGSKHVYNTENTNETTDQRTGRTVAGRRTKLHNTWRQSVTEVTSVTLAPLTKQRSGMFSSSPRQVPIYSANSTEYLEFHTA